VRLETTLFGATFQNPLLLAVRELGRWGGRHGVADWAALAPAPGGTR